MATKSKKVAVSTAMKKKLAQAAKKFKKVDAASGSSFVNDAIVDGSYGFELKEAKLVEGSGGKLTVEFHIELSEVLRDGDDDSVGEVAVARFNTETEQNLSYLKRCLSQFVEIDDDFDLAESLVETLEAITEAAPSGKCSVKMNGEFQQVYINKVDVDGDAGGDDEDEDEDEKPAKGKGKGKAPKGKPAKGKGKKAAAEEEDDEEDADEEDDEAEVEISKGDDVTFKKGKKTISGTVLKIVDETATVKDEDGTKHSVDVGDLEVVDAENDDEEDEDEEEEAPKGKKGGKGKKPAKEEEEDDEAEIEEGSKVSFTYKGEDVSGKVVSIDEEEETAEVKFKHAGKTITKSIPADKLEVE